MQPIQTLKKISFLQNHKTLVSSLVGVVICAGLGIWIMMLLKSNAAVSTQNTAIDESLFGDVDPNFVLFLTATQNKTFSLSDTSFMQSYLVRNAKDFTQIITPSATKGRTDPFTPYAVTGSTH